MGIALSVFTKPWPKMGLGELGRFVKGLGFEGVELPVRPGFQVVPEEAGRGLAAAVRELGSEGVKVFSVAGAADERMVEACGAAGVGVLRVMVPIDLRKGYHVCVGEFRRRCEGLMPALDRCGVKLGLQNHCDNEITGAAGLWQAIEPLDSRRVGAILDMGHCGLAGEMEEQALDIVWERLCMVNLKNAVRRRVDAGRGGEEGEAKWKVEWVGGREGLASWGKTVAELKRRGFVGTVCLTAEYSDGGRVNELIAEDAGYARELLGRP